MTPPRPTSPVPFALALCGLLLAAPAAAGPREARAWLARQGYAAPTATALVACHGYGCTRRAALPRGSDLVRRVRVAMGRGNGSPAAERRVLGAAVALYTAGVAARIGGRRDVPGSPPRLSGVAGQMDCLDATANMTSLLVALREEGLLVHHDVAPPQSRGLFLDGRYPHFSAVIVESRTGARWAVDPWARTPGQRPEILPLKRWLAAS